MNKHQALINTALNLLADELQIPVRVYSSWHPPASGKANRRGFAVFLRVNGVRLHSVEQEVDLNASQTQREETQDMVWLAMLQFILTSGLKAMYQKKEPLIYKELTRATTSLPIRS